MVKAHSPGAMAGFIPVTGNKENNTEKEHNISPINLLKPGPGKTAKISDGID